MQVSDYSYLTPEEAQKKFIKASWQIYVGQFKVRFFTRDVRSDYYLKYELAAFWEGRIQELHGWDDVLGQIKDWLYENIYLRVKALWDKYIRPIIDAILVPLRWLWGETKNLAFTTYRFARDAYNKVSEVYTKIVYDVISKLGYIWDWVYGLGSKIYGWVSEAMGVVWTWLVKLYNDYIRPGLDSLWGWIQNHLTFIGHLLAAVSNMQGVYHGATIFRFDNEHNYLVESFGHVYDILGGIPGKIWGALTDVFDLLKDGGKWLWGHVLKPLGELIWSKLEWVKDQIMAIFRKIWNGIQDAISGFLPITPENAEGVAVSMLSVAGLAAGGLLAMTAVWDLIHPFKDIIPGEVKAMMYDATSFKIIIGAIMGTMTTAAIVQPLKYHYNWILRPYRPAFKDVMEARARVTVSRAHLDQELRFYGINPDMRLTDPQIKPDVPWDIEGAIKVEEWPDMYINTVSDMYQHLSEVPLPYRALLKVADAGFYNRKLFWGLLLDSNYGPAASGLVLKGAEAAFVKRFKTNAENWYMDRYLRKQIGLDELVAGFTLLKWTPDMIEVLQEWAEPQKAQPDPWEAFRARFATSQMGLYREGLISEATFNTQMTAFGFVERSIHNALTVASADGDLRYATHIRSAAISAYRYGRLTEEGFLAELARVGIPGDKAQQFLYAERLRRGTSEYGTEEEAVKGYGSGVALKRFREGMTSQEDLRQELKSLGYSTTQIDRYVVAAILDRDYDFAQAVLSSVKAAFRKEHINDRQFTVILQQYGFVDDKILLELQLIKLAYGIGIVYGEASS